MLHARKLRLAVKMLILFVIVLNWFVISSNILFYRFSVRVEAAKRAGCNNSTAEPCASEIVFCTLIGGQVLNRPSISLRVFVCA